MLRPHSSPFSFPNLARSCWKTAVSRSSHALTSMPQETTTLGAPLGAPPGAPLGESQLEPLGAPPCTPAPSHGFYSAAFWRAARKMSLPPVQWRATAPTRHARPSITDRTFHRCPAPSRCVGNRSCLWGGRYTQGMDTIGETSTLCTVCGVTPLDETRCVQCDGESTFQDGTCLE